MAVDRRTALTGLLGLTGAGAAYSIVSSRAGSASAADVRPTAAASPVVREDGGAGFKSVVLAQVPIGAGGFVTGLDISADGQRFACRTDVANAYVRNRRDAAWRPLFSQATMRQRDLDALATTDGKKVDGYGVSGIRIAPSNDKVIYASYRGLVWRSEDGGRSVRLTSLPQKRMLANAGPQRLFNRSIDVHPKNPSVVVVGTWGDGAWYSTDGGKGWVEIALPPARNAHEGQPGLYLVQFDPAEPDRVYVFVTGIGLFRSDAGASGTFREVTGGPTHCSSMVIGSDSVLYLCENTARNTGGRVWRYTPARGWTSTLPPREALVIAINPANSSRLLAIEANGWHMQSEDAGDTFASLGKAKWHPSGGEIRWMGGLGTIFPAEVRFDPRVRDRVWTAQGVGIANGELGDGGVVVHDWSAGIEELCTFSILCVPRGKTFLAAWDKSFWRIDTFASYANDFRYPLKPGRSHNPNLVAVSTSMDFAPEDPRFLVGVIAPSKDAAPGYTTNGGDDWQAFEATPRTGWGVGGCIAAASRTNFVLLPANNATGVFTKDGGKSWTPIRLDGVNATDRFSNAYYVVRKNITADKSRPGTFALVYTTLRNNRYEEPLGGLWVSRDGGGSWSQMLKGVIGPGNTDPQFVMSQGRDARQFWQCQLDYVPGRPAELLYTPHADGKQDPLYWSVDDGRTWRDVHDKVRNVRAFGFGRSASGQIRPAVYFWGEVDGVRGLYASLDWFAGAPLLITQRPSPIVNQITCIAADPDRFGRIYVGTGCAGWVRVDIEV